MRVEGLGKLRRALRQLERDAGELREAHATVAQLVAAAAAARAPQRTGRLAASVRGNRAASRATVSAGGARLPYAGPIHWGWPARGIAGRPFIPEAAQATEPTWLPAYERELAAAVDRVGGTY